MTRRLASFASLLLLTLAGCTTYYGGGYYREPYYSDPYYSDDGYYAPADEGYGYYAEPGYGYDTYDYGYSSYTPFWGLGRYGCGYWSSCSPYWNSYYGRPYSGWSLSFGGYGHWGWYGSTWAPWYGYGGYGGGYYHPRYDHYHDHDRPRPPSTPQPGSRPSRPRPLYPESISTNPPRSAPGEALRPPGSSYPVGSRPGGPGYSGGSRPPPRPLYSENGPVSRPSPSRQAESRPAYRVDNGERPGVTPRARQREAYAQPEYRQPEYREPEYRQPEYRQVEPQARPSPRPMYREPVQVRSAPEPRAEAWQGPARSSGGEPVGGYSPPPRAERPSPPPRAERPMVRESRPSSQNDESTDEL